MADLEDGLRDAREAALVEAASDTYQAYCGCDAFCRLSRDELATCPIWRLRQVGKDASPAARELLAKARAWDALHVEETTNGQEYMERLLAAEREKDGLCKRCGGSGCVACDARKIAGGPSPASGGEGSFDG